MEPDMDGYAETAHNLVDHVIENAMKKLQAETGVRRERTVDSIRTNLSKEASMYHEPPKVDDFEVKNIEWLTIDGFTVDKAEAKIHEFIKTWDYQESWLYCVDFLSDDEHEFDVRFRFRARWSIPTRRKPVPRATASVYFTFVVSKVKPGNFPVDVFYIFETNQLVHKPGFSQFREKWLKDIIENKVIMMAGIYF